MCWDRQAATTAGNSSTPPSPELSTPMRHTTFTATKVTVPSTKLPAPPVTNFWCTRQVFRTNKVHKEWEEKMERLNKKYGLDYFSRLELDSESDGENYRYEHNFLANKISLREIIYLFHTISNLRTHVYTMMVDPLKCMCMCISEISNVHVHTLPKY